MKYFLLFKTIAIASVLFGQCNAQPPIKPRKPLPVQLILLLADKKETAFEIVNRENQIDTQILGVYELETWQPNQQVGKTIVAHVKPLNDTSQSLNKIILYYPKDQNGFGLFLLDTFVSNKPDFKIRSVFTANFDSDTVFEIGLTYSYGLQDSCESTIIRTVYYKKPINIGVIWEFYDSVFTRKEEDRFTCSCCIHQPQECKFDTELKIIHYLNQHPNER